MKRLNRGTKGKLVCTILTNKFGGNEMEVGVIKSNSICDYCKNRWDYKRTGYSCQLWYESKVCNNAEDFEGKELIEVEDD